MNERISIVTGASGGIGLETARCLAAAGDTVVLACRDLQRANAARDDIVASTGNRSVVPMTLDLADIASIDAFVAEFARRFGRLDVLVNNAAAMWRKRTVTASGWEATFAVNHVGAFRLTLGLLDLLKRSAPSRIVMVSSKLHVGAPLDLDDLHYEKRPYKAFGAYNATKLANVVFTRTLARKLEGTEVRIHAVHPGEAGTRIARDLGFVMVALMRILYASPKKATKTILYAATSAEAGTTSGAFFRDGQVAPHSPVADDPAVQERLWAATEALIQSQVK